MNLKNGRITDLSEPKSPVRYILKKLVNVLTTLLQLKKINQMPFNFLLIIIPLLRFVLHISVICDVLCTFLRLTFTNLCMSMQYALKFVIFFTRYYYRRIINAEFIVKVT